MSVDYITDDQVVSDEVYHSEPVPGPNTISKETLARFKTKTTRIINAFCRIPVGDLLTDTYGELEELAIKLFRKLVDGEDAELDQKDKYKLTDHGYVGPPLVNHTPEAL
jgi:hypothetical protein